MFGDTRELEWLENRKEAAIAANSWDEFCDGQPPMGDHYRKYLWLAMRWEFLKERGFVPAKTIYFPKIRTWPELVSDVRFLPIPTNVKQANGKYKSVSVIPPTHTFISGLRGDVPFGSIGGRRGYRDLGNGEQVRTHYGATSYGTYAVVHPHIMKSFNLVSGACSSLEAIKRDDGYLVIARDSHAIGDNWLALLPLDSAPITDMMPKDDRELIKADKEAQIAAWGETE